MFNLWDWLVNGFYALVMMTVYNLLPAGTDGQSWSNFINFTQFFKTGVFVVFELTWPALSLFNWVLLPLALAYNVLLFGLQLILTAWMFIKRLIPGLS